MRKQLAICFAAAAVVFAGFLHLSAPTVAAEEAAGAAGCTIEQFSSAIRAVHEMCRFAGYDGGSVVSCNDGVSLGECWDL